MQVVSEMFDRESKASVRQSEIQIKINDVEVTDVYGKLISATIEEVFGDIDDIGIGNFATSSVTMTLRNDKITPDYSIGDKFEINIRFKNLTMLTGEAEWTEYIPLGTYYVDSTPSLEKNIMTIIGYDEAVFGDVLYKNDNSFPQSMQSVLDDAVTKAGFTSGASVVVDPSYVVPYYNNTSPMSCRELIGYIAGCHGANAMISRDGLLEFKVIKSDVPVDNITISHLYSHKELNPIRKITNLVMRTDTESFESGSGFADETLVGNNPFMNQSILDNVVALIGGFEYLPIELSTICLPQLSVGDALSFEKMSGYTWTNTDYTWDTMLDRWDGIVGASTVILSNKILITGGIKSVILNRAKSPQESKYILEGTLTRRKSTTIDDTNYIKKTENYNGVRINETDGIKVTRTDDKVETFLNATDGILIKSRATVGGTFQDVFKVDTSGNLIMKGNFTLDAGSTINWSTVTPPTAGQVGALPQGTYIPTVPSYITSTKITSTTIESPTITAGSITGNTITGSVIVGGILSGNSIRGATFTNLENVGKFEIDAVGSSNLSDFKFYGGATSSPMFELYDDVSRCEIRAYNSTRLFLGTTVNGLEGIWYYNGSEIATLDDIVGGSAVFG